MEEPLVECEPGQQLEQISIVEVDAALCSEPVSEWWNFEEVVSSWDRKGFCVCDVECTEN